MPEPFAIRLYPYPYIHYFTIVDLMMFFRFPTSDDRSKRIRNSLAIFFLFFSFPFVWFFFHTIYNVRMYVILLYILGENDENTLEEVKGQNRRK